jgi:pimeloyl-ACP methyl ester carboxylesterase
VSTSLLHHPLLASRLFFPRRVALEQPYFVTAADGVTRLACYRTTVPDAPITVLHFHGSGEVVADYVPEMAEEFASLGANAVFAEYRGYGASTGSPSLGAMLDDAEAIFAAARVPAARLVLFGRSIGSLFAIELAARHPDIGGLVLESGIADPLERTRVRISPEELGVSRAELEAAISQRLDHRGKLGRYPGKMLVLHAAHDTLIVPSHAERNVAWGGAAAGNKELVIFPFGDHNSIFFANRDEYLARLGRFLRRLTETANDNA